MMQSSWPGFRSPIFDPTPIPLANDANAGTTTPSGGAWGSLATAGTGDGVSRPWWQQSSGPLPSITPNGNTYDFVQSIIGQIQNWLSQLFGATQQTGPSQQAVDATLSSTGDPHLAETGTVAANGANASVDTHFDSMVSHHDLVDSNAVPGGYRVSTQVTAPAANGVTYNQSATVHTGFGQDEVTMNRDGSFAITDHGNAVTLSSGQTTTLSAGETVASNTDGSLTVTATDGNGGTIATTMRATGSGVDVTTHAQNIMIGGDIANGNAVPSTAERTAMRHHHRNA